MGLYDRGVHGYESTALRASTSLAVGMWCFPDGPEENMINGLKATEIIDDHYLMAIDDPNLGSSLCTQ
jgi:hypothetical protein